MKGDNTTLVLRGISLSGFLMAAVFFILLVLTACDSSPSPRQGGEQLGQSVRLSGRVGIYEFEVLQSPVTGLCYEIITAQGMTDSNTSHLVGCP